MAFQAVLGHGLDELTFRSSLSAPSGLCCSTAASNHFWAFDLQDEPICWLQFGALQRDRCLWLLGCLRPSASRTSPPALFHSSRWLSKENKQEPKPVLPLILRRTLIVGNVEPSEMGVGVGPSTPGEATGSQPLVWFATCS